MELKRGKIQSFPSKHCRKGKVLIKKYSHCEKNRVLDYINKFVNKLLNMYPLTTFAIEKLNKQKMFEDANGKLSKKISKTVWRSIHHVLKYKAALYNSFVKEVNPYLTSKFCPRCDGFPERLVELKCEKCRFTLDRQLNASLNIHLKMCGFSHIRDIPRMWVGVIPLKGRRSMNGYFPMTSMKSKGVELGIKRYQAL
jgi:putative transposase